MKGDGNPTLAVVVIGRNPGERLRWSLASVGKMRRPAGGIEVVYVDTASTDGSPSVAANFGIPVIRLHPEWPSAALARNAGWQALTAPYILFLDGDSQIEEDFAISALERFRDPRVAIVWGRLREAHPAASIYNRFMDLQWICLRHLRPGPTFYGTGIGLVRRSVLEAVNGFDNSLTAGENTELGLRAQRLGYLVLHADLPMARHDSELLRFSQYWRRFFREGYSYARLEDIFSNTNQPLFRFEFSASTGALSASLPVGALTGYLLAGSWVTIALPLAILILLLARVSVSSLPKTGSLSGAVLFSLHWHLKLIPNLLGRLAYVADKRTGRRRGLIEHQ